MNNEFNNQNNMNGENFNQVNVVNNNGGGVATYKLVLNRKKNFVACLVKFDIIIDGVKVGKIKNGQVVELNVTAGNHTISINKNNAINIFVNGDVSADVVVFGADNFGITNISGQASVNMNDVSNNYFEKNNSKSNLTLLISIILPIISIILFYTSSLYIPPFIFGIVVGYAVVNIFGLKSQKGNQDYKSNMIKNWLAIIITIVFSIVYIIFFNK